MVGWVAGWVAAARVEKMEGRVHGPMRHGARAGGAVSPRMGDGGPVVLVTRGV